MNTNRTNLSNTTIASMIVATEGAKFLAAATTGAASIKDAIAARAEVKAHTAGLLARIAQGDAALIANIVASFDARMAVAA